MDRITREFKEMNTHKEAMKIIREMDKVEAIEILYLLAEDYPELLLDYCDEILDEEWGINEAIEANCFFN